MQLFSRPKPQILASLMLLLAAHSHVSAEERNITDFILRCPMAIQATHGQTIEQTITQYFGESSLITELVLSKKIGIQSSLSINDDSQYLLGSRSMDYRNPVESSLGCLYKNIDGNWMKLHFLFKKEHPFISMTQEEDRLFYKAQICSFSTYKKNYNECTLIPAFITIQNSFKAEEGLYSTGSIIIKSFDDGEEKEFIISPGDYATIKRPKDYVIQLVVDEYGSRLDMIDSKDSDSPKLYRKVIFLDLSGSTNNYQSITAQYYSLSTMQGSGSPSLIRKHFEHIPSFGKSFFRSDDFNEFTNIAFTALYNFFGNNVLELPGLHFLFHNMFHEMSQNFYSGFEQVNPLGDSDEPDQNELWEQTLDQEKKSWQEIEAQIYPHHKPWHDSREKPRNFNYQHYEKREKPWATSSSINRNASCQTLNLEPNCTRSSAKKAFRALANVMHPYKGGSIHDFVKIREAYEFIQSH